MESWGLYIRSPNSSFVKTPASQPPSDVKNGTVLTTEREQEVCSRKEQFQEVLNCPQPDTLANPQPAREVLNINISPIKVSEIKDALKAMKSGKAAGINSI